jgi:hypothetical protein
MPAMNALNSPLIGDIEANHLHQQGSGENHQERKKIPFQDIKHFKFVN